MFNSAHVIAESREDASSDYEAAPKKRSNSSHIETKPLDILAGLKRKTPPAANLPSGTSAQKQSFKNNLSSLYKLLDDEE